MDGMHTRAVEQAAPVFYRPLSVSGVLYPNGEKFMSYRKVSLRVAGALSQKRSLFLLTAVLGIAATGTAARADNFDFSFTGNNGTVTGEIFGLTNNGVSNQHATDIVIDSAPSAFALATPIDLFPLSSDIANNFTESNGQITACGVYVSGPGGSLALALNYASTLDSFGVENVSPVLSTTVSGSAAFSDITFTPATAVPEPASMSLLGVGATALLRRRRRIA
jgi:hypothetical protein